MQDKCPGAEIILMPTIKLKTCPECGEEVELLSSDVAAKCPGCGFTLYNDVTSCVLWCEYAKECVGEKVYNRIMATVPKEYLNMEQIDDKDNNKNQEKDC